MERLDKEKKIEEFIEKAKEVHGDRYNYDKFIYINNKTKGIIHCNICGNDFEMIPANHVCKKQGCPKCNGTRKYTTEEWIEKAKSIHGNKYDYSKVEYVNAETKVCIICPEHGEFFKKPFKHIQGQGCPKCSKPSVVTFDEFVKRAKEKHGDKYKYYESEYKGYNVETVISCPIHGCFKQKPSLHAAGHSCYKCSLTQRGKNRSIPFSEFVERAKKVHGDKYEYFEDEYKNFTTPTKILCKKHGVFYQTPDKHINRKFGCKKCSSERESKEQLLTIDEFIKRSKLAHGDKYDYSKVKYNGNSEKVEIICKKHGSFFQKPCKHWIGQGCPKCKQSQLEREVEVLLNKIGKPFVYQATKKDLQFLNMKSLDFYLPDYNIGIECQGIQHFEDCGFLKYEGNIKRDIEKYNDCRNNGLNVIYFTNLKEKAKKLPFYDDKIVIGEINELEKFLNSYETSNKKENI